MRNKLKRLLALPVLALMAFLALPAPTASAHGEDAQESFLRMGTVAFWDVKYSDTRIKQGEEVTLTGTAKILEAWPEQLGEPKMGFLSIVAPGPVVLIKERTVNGEPAPHAIEVEKGRVYKFEMTLEGRRTGKWHIHPIFGIEGAGSLIGPGKYFHVSEGEERFVNQVSLASGEKVNLENYGLNQLVFWAIVWGVVGMAWLCYWIVPKRTVTRLPVTSQIPLNTDGMAYGLITKRDHKMMNAIMGVTLLLLAGGWVYQANAYPDKMPQQVLRFEPRELEAAPAFAQADLVESTYVQETDEVTMTVEVENEGDKPMTVQSFITANHTFPVEGVSEPSDRGRAVVEVSPSPTIQPGETKTLTLKIQDHIWSEENLMPVTQSRLQITGVLRLKDEAGTENFLTVQSFVKAVTA